MIEDVDSARGQLLRADHLFHVTLKYTRTVDVIRNTIERLIGALDFAIKDALENNKSDVPKLIKLRNEALKKLFPRNKNIKEILEFYETLKNIHKADYSVKEEYRKNVTLITDIAKVNVELLKEYFERTKEYVRFLQEIKKK
jgi:hypothetical protein